MRPFFNNCVSNLDGVAGNFIDWSNVENVIFCGTSS